MRHSRVSVFLALALGALAATRANGQTPPAGCTPDATSTISDTMPSVPDMETITGQVAWKSTQAFTVAFDLQSGKDPYPNKQTANGSGYYWWWSCGLASGTRLPVAYTITFTTSHKTIKGRIIIKAK